MNLNKYIDLEKSNLIVLARKASEEIGSEPIISELSKGVKIAYFYFLDIKENIYNKNNIFIKLREFYSIEKLRQKCIILKNKYDIKFIVIDDIELLRCEKARTECKSVFEEQKETAKLLKELSEELEINILVISNISSRFYQRKSDDDLLVYLENETLRKCADVIIFLYKEKKIVKEGI